MNLKTFALLGLPVVLFGCPTDDSDSDLPIETGDTDVVDTDDTDPPTPAPLGVTVDFATSTITLTIENGVGTYDWGFAQTAVTVTPWYGEDCDTGTAGFTYCHPAGNTGVELTTGAAPDTVVEGQTTVVPTDTPPMTYILISNDTQDCWVWGHDTSFYDDFPSGPCTEIAGVVNPL